MIVHAILTALDVLVFVAVLAFFLNRISGQLKSIGANLGKITFGVRAVETQCAVIGPATEEINRGLEEVEAGLTMAAERAEELVDQRLSR